MKVHTYPELPQSCQKLWYYLNKNDIKYSCCPDGCRIGVHVSTDQKCKYKHKEWPFPVINGELLDCSKREIERIHKKVFGYGSFIEGKFSGYAVLKEDSQCSKSAKLRFFIGSEMPKLKPNQFIQQLLGMGIVTEYRAVIMGDIVAWIVKEKKVTSDNLCGTVKSAQWTEDKTKFLTNFDRKKIMQFCQEMKLEFGELDILLSNDKLYIIDVNDQPGDRAFHFQFKDFDTEGLQKYLCGKFVDFINTKI